MVEERICKYRDWTRGDTEALLNGLGGGDEVRAEEIGRRIGSGDLKVVIEGKVVQVLPAVRTQFTKGGMFIRPREVRSVVCNPNLAYQLKQPKWTLAERYGRSPQPGISYEEFGSRTRELLERFLTLKNADKVVALPILIPQMDIKDLGETTEGLVALAADAYQRQFPGRSFTNYRRGNLVGKISPFPGAGYEKLIEALQQRPVVGLWIPDAMLGYSLNAQREQGQHLPKGFTLTGTIEPVIGWIMYPDAVAHSIHTPLYDCPAVQEGTSGRSFVFYACDDSAHFGWRIDPANTNGAYSGGLLFW